MPHKRTYQDVIIHRLLNFKGGIKSDYTINESGASAQIVD